MAFVLIWDESLFIFYDVSVKNLNCDCVYTNEIYKLIDTPKTS